VRQETDRPGRFVDADRVVAEVAAGQCAQISTEQLRAAGLTERQIRRRVQRGWLHRGPYGVYSVGVPAVTPQARWMAATLATRGTLGARSAAALWPVWPNAHGDVVVFGRGRSRPGIRVLRGRLDRRDVTRREGIPVTTPARTLLDLAAELSPRLLGDALETARVRRLVTDDGLRDVLARHPRHRGARRLGDALTGPFLRSRLEADFRELVRAELADLPEPEYNADVGGDEVDVLFEGLAVELDGRQHAGRWAQDAAKDARLRARGLAVLRFTRWDVVRDRRRTADAVRRAWRARRT
jgi:hypothetical protein